LSKKWLAPALLLVVFAVAVLGSGNPESARAHHLCPNTGSPLGPYSFETYEEPRVTYGRTFDLAGRNMLLPELPGFALPALETGPRSNGSGQLQTGYIPPVLLKAVAWIEASWAQADYSVPYGAKGPGLVSHDCGYGLMQVTTGMQNVTAVPSVDQAMIGGHYAFNIARGAQILASKWNAAPEYRPIVGSRDPAILEDWYFAIWGYNGFSSKNHPLNPMYPANRAPYSCGPTNDGFGHNRTHYPYQELVYGCIARPPIVNGVPLWPPQPVNPANPTHFAFAHAFTDPAWGMCSAQLQCAPMDIPTSVPNFRDNSPLTASRSDVIGNPVAVVSAANMRLTIAPPAASASTTLAIGNVGSGILSWRITSSAPWLQVSRHQGVTKNGTAPSGVTIAALAGGLPFGTHTASLVLESPGSGNSRITIPVTVDNLSDGGLFRGSAPAVYLVTGGLRRHVPDPVTFDALGLEWADLRVVPDPILNQLPTGTPMLKATGDGMLVKGPGPEVYVMQGGHRHHVATWAAFVSCGYGQDAVKHLEGATINAIPLGPPETGAPCPRPSFPDGTLLHGAGHRVYVMVQGVKRHVPDALTMDVRRMREGDINHVAESTLALVEQGSPLLSARTTGTLLKGTGPMVYVMDGGAKRHISSPDVMTACGYSWEAIQLASDPALGAVASGPPLASAPCAKFSPADGSTLTGNVPHVYLIKGGLKRHVPNPATFAVLAMKPANLDRVHDSLLAQIPPGAPLTSVLHDGQLVRGSANIIYVMQNGLRRHVSSPSVMASCNYNWQAIVTLPNDLIASIPPGAPVTGAPCPRVVFPQGTLLQGSAPAAFVADGQVRRHVTSPATFVACGYKWGNVDKIPDAVLTSMAVGSGVVSPPCP